MALITTVLPTYRRPKWLARALQSVLSQTIPDFEVRVYDNASGDETEQVVKDFAARDSRVIYHCHPDNLGPIENFRFGVTRVTTPYFNILSDDDLLYPDFFERALAALTRYREAMLFAGLLKHVDIEGRLIAIPMDGWEEGLHQPPNAAARWIAEGDTWTSVMFRSEILQSTGNIDSAIGLEADLDFLMRSLAITPMVFERNVCAAFTIHERSAMSTGSVRELIEGMRGIESKAGEIKGLPTGARQKLKQAVIAANASRLFRLMLKVAIRGARTEIDPAVSELRDHFRHPIEAQMLALAASSGLPGTVMRATLERLYALRRGFRDLRAKGARENESEVAAPTTKMLAELK